VVRVKDQPPMLEVARDRVQVLKDRPGPMTKRSALVATLALALLSASLRRASRDEKSGGSACCGSDVDGHLDGHLRRRMRELESSRNGNIVIEDRMAEGRLDRLPGLAADLVRVKVDVIIASLLIMNAPQ